MYQTKNQTKDSAKEIITKRKSNKWEPNLNGGVVPCTTPRRTRTLTFQSLYVDSPGITVKSRFANFHWFVGFCREVVFGLSCRGQGKERQEQERTMRENEKEGTSSLVSCRVVLVVPRWTEHHNCQSEPDLKSKRNRNGIKTDGRTDGQHEIRVSCRGPCRVVVLIHLTCKNGEKKPRG